MSEPTSIVCDRRDHDACDGFARWIDQDGNSAFICQCSCHTQHAPTHATPSAASGGDGEGTGNDG